MRGVAAQDEGDEPKRTARFIIFDTKFLVFDARFIVLNTKYIIVSH